MTIMASLLLVRGRPPRPPHLLTQARRWGLPIRLAACLAGLVVYVSQQSTESCGEPRGHSSILPSVFTDRIPEHTVCQ
jgi:hypothetical protein